MPGARDRVSVTTTTTGTGTLTLSTATSGFRTFATAYTAANTTVSYCLTNGTAWETGVGTYNKAANTLTRSLDASSTGSLLSLSGTTTVAVEFLSRDNVVDFPLLAVAHAGINQAITGGAWTTLVMSQTPAIDTHAGYSTTTGIYTIPQAGTYDITGKVRPSDSLTGGTSVAIGMDVVNADSAGVVWGSMPGGASNRFVLTNSRVMVLAAGAAIRLFTFGDIAFTVTNAELNVNRIR